MSKVLPGIYFTSISKYKARIIVNKVFALLYGAALLAAVVAVALSVVAVTARAQEVWEYRTYREWGRMLQPDAKIIHVPPDWPVDEEELAAWEERCKPVIKKDRYGVRRYSYAKPGCEFGAGED